MKLKNYEIYKLFLILYYLKNNNETKLSVKTGFKILNNIKILTPYFEAIEESKVSCETQEDYNELSDVENEITLHLLLLSELEKLELTLEELEGIMPIIKEEEESGV